MQVEWVRGRWGKRKRETMISNLLFLGYRNGNMPDLYIYYVQPCPFLYFPIIKIMNIYTIMNKVESYF